MIRNLILSMFLMDVLWWAWAHVILRRVPHARRWRVALGVFMGVQFGCLLILLGGRLMGERIDALFPRLLLIGVFLWHFILLPISVVWMMIGLGAAGAGSLRRKATVTQTVEDKPGISRRELLRTVSAMAPPVATVVLAGGSVAQLEQFRVRRIDVVLPGLPADLDGVRIAHVSDIHVGRFTTERILRRIIDSTNDLRSDLVLLTGDLINFSLSELSGSLDAVNRMQGRYGTYMIQGNHDLMEGREEFDARVRAAGVPLLVNESTMVSVRGVPVQLLGLRWGPGRNDAGVEASMDELSAQLQPGAFPILLAHHPHAFDPAAAAGIPLTLAGHTHGGQIMPFGVGFGPLMYRYWSGLYERGASKLVVSNGVGNWFPLRINAPAEIVRVTLRRADT